VGLNSGVMRSLASVSAALKRAVLKTGPEKTQGNGKVNGRSVDIQAICHTHTPRAGGNAWSSSSGPPLRLHAIIHTQKQLYDHTYTDIAVSFAVLIATDSNAVQLKQLEGQSNFLIPQIKS
jgi:hypothetical protein